MGGGALPVDAATLTGTAGHSARQPLRAAGKYTGAGREMASGVCACSVRALRTEQAREKLKNIGQEHSHADRAQRRQCDKKPCSLLLISHCQSILLARRGRTAGPDMQCTGLHCHPPRPWGNLLLIVHSHAPDRGEKNPANPESNQFHDALRI